MHYWLVKRLVSKQIIPLLVCEKVGIKVDYTINRKEPFWKRRIGKDFAILRNDLNRINDWFKRRSKKRNAKLKCELKKKCKIKVKSFNMSTEELKQHIPAKTLKLKRCNSRVKQYRQSRTFKNNKNVLYGDLYKMR